MAIWYKGDAVRYMLFNIARYTMWKHDRLRLAGRVFDSVGNEHAITETVSNESGYIPEVIRRGMCESEIQRGNYGKTGQGVQAPDNAGDRPSD